MNDSERTPASIDEYIEKFPKDVQHLLEAMRQTIREAAPQASEAITYGMPTFQLKGNLVHFAAYQHHIGFYPAPTGVEAFTERLSPYLSSKSTLQFPLDKPIPFDLVTDIVKYRVEEALKQ